MRIEFKIGMVGCSILIHQGENSTSSKFFTLTRPVAQLRLDSSNINKRSLKSGKALRLVIISKSLPTIAYKVFPRSEIF